MGNRHLLFLSSLMGLLSMMVPAARADAIKLSITVDNSYAIYYGTQTAATTFVGSNFDWTNTEVYNFNLPNNSYLYIVTVSDGAVAQGFLSQFENLTQNYKFYSQDSQWQVMATGLRDPSKTNYGAPYPGSAADLSLLTNEILDANGGGNPSNGWVSTTPGPSNGAAPWGFRPNIDAAARWVWYGTDADGDPTQPGNNNDEWLVFRIAFAATPVPVPSGVILFGAGFALVGLMQLRKVRASRKAAVS